MTLALEELTLNFLVAVVNTFNTKTHSSKEIAEFSLENADVKNICYCKQRMKTKLSLLSECVDTKLCKLCTSFTRHLHSSCGMVWYRTLRGKSVGQNVARCGSITPACTARCCLSNWTLTSGLGPQVEVTAEGGGKDGGGCRDGGDVAAVVGWLLNVPATG